MVKHPAFNHQVSKAEATAETSQVFHLNIVSPEEVKKLVGLVVVNVEHFLTKDIGVVGTV